MPTDNPKISAYVSQAVFDRFKEFQQEQGLSMSQAATVIFAEYFGLKETVKEITEGIVIGGVTLDRVEAIEEQLRKLLEKVDFLESKSSLPKSASNQLKLPVQIESEQTTDGLSSELPIFDREALASRLDFAAGTVVNKSSKPDFSEWSKSHDPDGISWVAIKTAKGYQYTPIKETSSKLLSRLQDSTSQS